ncbi:MAG: hypothetical protein HeimC3_43230 [Candidatus Heimdallarchaeota archaeon LC_3]|nr:MAG: hypothetical protein HeimC3_43230 [Candidatus Heimdallarchaeota archaeon LC_3]
MAESEYFQAVIDTCKLLSLKTVNFSDSDNNNDSLTNSIYFQLDKIEIELDKNVPRISPLYSALNIDKESIQSQSNYWEGVRDTTNLIRNYLSYNKKNFTREDYELFLQEILVKSSQKLEPRTSPLIDKLGLKIDIQHENIHKSSQKQELNEIDTFTKEINQKITSSEKLTSPITNRDEQELFEEKIQESDTKISFEADPFSEEINQEKTLPINESSKTVTTWEFETPVENKNLEKSEEMVELALEELKRENTISNIRNGLLSQINSEITKLDSETEIKPKEVEKQIPIVQLSPKIEEKDILNENESFSSSLKDALKMLRSDEDNIED